MSADLFLSGAANFVRDTRRSMPEQPETKAKHFLAGGTAHSAEPKSTPPLLAVSSIPFGACFIGHDMGIWPGGRITPVPVHCLGYSIPAERRGQKFSARGARRQSGNVSAVGIGTYRGTVTITGDQS